MTRFEELQRIVAVLADRNANDLLTICTVLAHLAGSVAIIADKLSEEEKK